jgi:hypothetical protein
MSRVIAATKLMSIVTTKKHIATRTGLPELAGTMLPEIQEIVYHSNISSETASAGVPAPPNGAKISAEGMNMSRKR